MTYQETIHYLYNVTPMFEHIGAVAYKPGLQTTEALDEHYGHPHRQYKTIHVAGTNGKGSCSHTLAAILQQAGFKVGLYTSPHIVDFRERIRVNGQTISEKYVIDFVDDFIKWNNESSTSNDEPLITNDDYSTNNNQRLYPSFFELATAMALKYFADQQVDIAVVEVGLGGRLDCTNIITPILSIITNISFDHTQFLGNTLAEIAAEKAGIMKRNVPVVIGETTAETRPVFEEKARLVGSPIYFAEDIAEVISSSSNNQGGRNYLTRNFGTLVGQLGGNYQEKNTNTILAAVALLPAVGRADIANGFAQVCETTGLVGRWQTIHQRPLAICDTGHNVGGWQYLAPQIKNQPCKQLRMVFGMVDDKDIDTVLTMLPKDAVYYFTKAQSKRAIPEQRILEKATALGLHGTAFPNVKDAYRQAMSEAGPDDFIFVGGSSYVVADLLS